MKKKCTISLLSVPDNSTPEVMYRKRSNRAGPIDKLPSGCIMDQRLTLSDCVGCMKSYGCNCAMVRFHIALC